MSFIRIGMTGVETSNPSSAPDEMDVATDRDDLRGLAEMRAPDELQHMVHTAVAA